MVELLSVNEKDALQFFMTGLSDVSEPDVDRDELLYNASVLAHFSQVSTSPALDFPTPSTLQAVFENFVFDTTFRGDPIIMETAGAQCLLLTGFFGDQMRGRHNVDWFANLGAGFLHQAAVRHDHQRRSLLLSNVANKFDLWRNRHVKLSRELRDMPYLLQIPPQV
ncbi:MAG: hypothetical protein WAZ44_04520 [Minisyncoccia bacterium]